MTMRLMARETAVGSARHRRSPIRIKGKRSSVELLTASLRSFRWLCGEKTKGVEVLHVDIH